MQTVSAKDQNVPISHNLQANVIVQTTTVKLNFLDFTHKC